MPAPTRVQTYISTVGSGTSRTITSIALQAGDLVVIDAITYDNAGADVFAALPTGGSGLSWTARGVVAISGLESRKAWTTPVGTAQTASLTVGTSAGGHTWMFTATVWRNHDGVGASGGFTFASSAQTSVAPNFTLPGVVADSAIQYGNGDWNTTTGARTYRTTGIGTPTETGYTNTGAGGLHFNHAVWPGVPSAGDKAVGQTAPDDQKWAAIAVEIKGKSAESIAASEAITVTETVTAVDSISSVEAVAVTETVTVTDAENVATTEAITVAETVTVADFSTENVSAVDTLTLAETLTVTDAATIPEPLAVTETIGIIEEATPVVEAFTVSETVSLQDTQFLALAESLDLAETITVLDVPFTAALPLRGGPVYDLVVVARIPQPGGPPMLVEVDPIPFESLSYTTTLSRAQDMSATCLGTSLPESILQLLRPPVETLVELHLTRGGKIVFAGPLYTYDQADGEKITFHARGLLSYLRRMRFRADTTFTQVDQFTIVKAMIDQWQAVEWGHFGLDTSAVGESSVLRDGTYLRNDLHDIGQRVEELGARINGFDIEVDPQTRRVQLWYPGKGVDRSTGEDAVVFDAQSLESSDVSYSVSPEDLASEVFATGTGGDATLFSAPVNAELLSKIGRSAVSGTFDSVIVQATLDDHAQAMLDARSGPLIVPGPKARITADTDLEAYDVGDTVAFEAPGPLGVAGAFRLRSQTVSVTEAGEESIAIEFV